MYRELLSDEVAQRVRIDSSRLTAALGVRETPVQSRGAQTEQRSRPAISGGRGSVVRQAIRALVHYPQIALQAASSERLEGIDRPGIPLLIELLNELQENPCTNSAALLERWRGRPDFDPLFRLASTEYPVDAAGAACELNDALLQLFPEQGDQRLDELLRKQASEGLTDAERTELQRFLTRPAPLADVAGHRT